MGFSQGHYYVEKVIQETEDKTSVNLTDKEKLYFLEKLNYQTNNTFDNKFTIWHGLSTPESFINLFNLNYNKTTMSDKTS